MSQTEKNLYALQDYIRRKETEDNGNTQLFKASVTYYNEKTRNRYSIIDMVHANYNCGYGSYNVYVENMPDEPDVFLEWSTKFGVWKYEAGILTIDGVDKTGTRGNYTVTLC